MAVERRELLSVSSAGLFGLTAGCLDAFDDGSEENSDFPSYLSAWMPGELTTASTARIEVSGTQDADLTSRSSNVADSIVELFPEATLMPFEGFEIEVIELAIVLEAEEPVTIVVGDFDWGEEPDVLTEYEGVTVYDIDPPVAATDSVFIQATEYESYIDAARGSIDRAVDVDSRWKTAIDHISDALVGVVDTDPPERTQKGIQLGSRRVEYDPENEALDLQELLHFEDSEFAEQAVTELGDQPPVLLEEVVETDVKQEAAEVTYFERVRPNQVSDSTYPEKGPAYIAPGDIEIEPTEDGWVGRSPSVIDGVENPYLELREGEEYTFVLVDTADLEVFQIMGGGEIIDDYELDLAERDGAARLEFVATDQMQGYSSRFLSGRLRVGAPAMISS